MRSKYMTHLCTSVVLHVVKHKSGSPSFLTFRRLESGPTEDSEMVIFIDSSSFKRLPELPFYVTIGNGEDKVKYEVLQLDR